MMITTRINGEIKIYMLEYIRCTLVKLSEVVKPGITTAQINEISEECTLKQEAKWLIQRISGFPTSVCASVNEGVIQGRRFLQESYINVNCEASNISCHGYATK